MAQADTKSRFRAALLRPASPGDGERWAFVVLPKAASGKLPRRGRTSVMGRLDGQEFLATLEPDGRLGHWLPIGAELLDTSGADYGDVVEFEIMSVAQEPEPNLPPDLRAALSAAPRARALWDDTTTLARVDWIHWITTARQSRTRAKRIADACAKLAAGERRVCCFDPSGFYSKAFSAPKPAR